jgi:hypothetical protein
MDDETLVIIGLGAAALLYFGSDIKKVTGAVGNLAETSVDFLSKPVNMNPTTQTVASLMYGSIMTNPVYSIPISFWRNIL